METMTYADIVKGDFPKLEQYYPKTGQWSVVKSPLDFRQPLPLQYVNFTNKEQTNKKSPSPVSVITQEPPKIISSIVENYVATRLSKKQWPELVRS